MINPNVKLRYADRVFIVVATLHRENPSSEDFSTSEILERAAELNLIGSKATFSTHLSGHCTANKPPQPDKDRMLFSTGWGRCRLLKKTDEIHPLRTGKIFPDLKDLPSEYFELVAWAKKRYEQSGDDQHHFAGLISLVGSGGELWRDEPADQYVERLRGNW